MTHTAAEVSDGVGPRSETAAATGRGLSPNGRLLTAGLAPVLAVLALAHYGIGIRGFLYALFAAVLMLLAVTDFETRLLPNRVVYPATAIMLAGNLARAPGDATQWLIAGAGAAAFFLVPTFFSRDAVGLGDVKLAGLIGVSLGSRVIPALIVACFAVFPFALWIVVRGGHSAARETALPFGPFLVFGALVALFFA
jgi:leader peptidase (prepilin peptidase)/N-methyltransferase